MGLNAPALFISKKYTEDTIKGEGAIKGNPGPPGPDGPEGPEGKSAYKVAVDAGFVGTEEEWLASLKGEKGDPGSIENAKISDMTDVDISGLIDNGILVYNEEHKVWMIKNLPYVPSKTSELVNDSKFQTEDDVKAITDPIEAIAKGRLTGYVFNTKADLDLKLLDAEFVKVLNLGDNFYIIAKDTPDYWWDGTGIQELETGKIDLSGYATKEELDEIKLFKFPNAVIHGEPTVNNGQISGFSASNYLVMPFTFDFSGKSFEIGIAFTTKDDVTTPQNLLGSKFCIAAFINNGKFALRVSSNGTSWDVVDNEANFVVEPNKTYYVKINFNRLTYKISYSLDGKVYTDDISIVSTLEPIAGQVYIGVGNNFNNPFKGIINFNKFELKVNNTVYWEGMDDVGLATRADVDMSNLSEAGEQKIKDILSLIDGLDVKIRNGKLTLEHKTSEGDVTQLNIEATSSSTSVSMMGGNGELELAASNVKVVDDLNVGGTLSINDKNVSEIFADTDLSNITEDGEGVIRSVIAHDDDVVHKGDSDVNINDLTISDDLIVRGTLMLGESGDSINVGVELAKKISNDEIVLFDLPEKSGTHIWKVGSREEEHTYNDKSSFFIDSHNVVFKNTHTSDCSYNSTMDARLKPEGFEINVDAKRLSGGHAEKDRYNKIKLGHNGLKVDVDTLKLCTHDLGGIDVSSYTMTSTGRVVQKGAIHIQENVKISTSGGSYINVGNNNIDMHTDSNIYIASDKAYIDLSGGANYSKGEIKLGADTININNMVKIINDDTTSLNPTHRRFEIGTYKGYTGYIGHIRIVSRGSNETIIAHQGSDEHPRTSKLTLASCEAFFGIKNKIEETSGELSRGIDYGFEVREGVAHHVYMHSEKAYINLSNDNIYMSSMDTADGTIFINAFDFDRLKFYSKNKSRYVTLQQILDKISL